MLITADQQGGRSAFLFTNLHENAGIADKEFVFVMPRGVDVITEGH
jgi:outer membrane lipoprotein-sorting protein